MNAKSKKRKSDFLNRVTKAKCRAGGALLATSALVFTGCQSQVQTSYDYPPPAVPTADGGQSSGGQARRGANSSLRAGDVLELFVREDVSFNGRYPVRERGDVILPSVGRISVANSSVDQAAARIKSALERSQLHRATVMVDRVQTFQEPLRVGGAAGLGGGHAKCVLTVYMTGQCKRAGQHKIPLPPRGSLGVYEALLITGGVSEFADYRNVHVVRTDCDGVRHCIPVDVQAIRECSCDDFPIGDGDIVEVPEKIFGF